MDPLGLSTALRRRTIFLFNPSARWRGFAALWAVLIVVAAGRGIALAAPAETVLYSFTGGSDGGNPTAGLIADTSGNLYGTTSKGVTSGAGVVYKVSPSAPETVLYAYTGGSDGGNP
jgi:uncharacterized repeat protein (TIGR03803 family)